MMIASHSQERRAHREENASFVLEILYRYLDSCFDDNSKKHTF